MYSWKLNVLTFCFVVSTLRSRIFSLRLLVVYVSFRHAIQQATISLVQSPTPSVHGCLCTSRCRNLLWRGGVVFHQPSFIQADDSSVILSTVFWFTDDYLLLSFSFLVGRVSCIFSNPSWSSGEGKQTNKKLGTLKTYIAAKTQGPDWALGFGSWSGSWSKGGSIHRISHCPVDYRL